ncbi:putative feruloyl esterase b [Diaporthe ampelina]|uniref:Carboxylic ester hydrolase n=1 Tax=Diaporthe ampelina TaxID=1214573 RepID=A0A0G2FAW3_9PEZI|nr:putative feruloyl esterase b [Diaporthe ampelina]
MSFDPASAGITNATVTEHAFIESGTNLSLPDNDPSCGGKSQVVSVDLCRVALQIATSERSGVVAEIWLPGSWNGRLVTTGNGGLGGCIDYSGIAYTAKNGFASVGTNNGHNGTSGIQFLNNTEVVVDFAWRAVHTGVEAGKALMQPFYGETAIKSYFLGCSLGGRQAIKAAEIFPDDFDGVVAGPVGSSNFITPAFWKTTIHEEVLRQCDMLDGASDGIIEDPILCDFDPAPLVCGASSNSSACLSSAQVEIVRQVFEPYLWGNGTLLFPRMNPGGEIMSADGLYNGQPWALSQNWFRYAIYNNPDWDPAAYTLADAESAENLNPGNIRTWPSSLSEFQDRGGKIVMFHGLQDNQITSLNSPRFYDHLAEGMSYTPEQMDDFLRFFRISGMFHCNSGPGAWVVVSEK